MSAAPPTIGDERLERAQAWVQQERTKLERRQGLLRELSELESKYSDITSKAFWSSMNLMQAHACLESEIKKIKEQLAKAEHHLRHVQMNQM